MPNITLGAEGNRSYRALAKGFTLGDEVGRSNLAGDGSALVIHQDADDNRTDPDGNSGDRIACGGVEAVVSTPTMTQSREGKVFSAQSNTLIPAAERPTEELMTALELPEGFSIEVFAEDSGNPRMMAQGKDGTVYVTRGEEGDVMALVDEDGTAMPTRSMAENLLTLTASPFMRAMSISRPTPASTAQPSRPTATSGHSRLSSMTCPTPDSIQTGRSPSGRTGCYTSLWAAPVTSAKRPTQDMPWFCGRIWTVLNVKSSLPA